MRIVSAATKILKSPKAADEDALSSDITNGLSTSSYSTEYITPQTSSGEDLEVGPKRPLAPFPKGKDRSTEKLMNPARRAQRVLGWLKVYRDDVDAISDQFVLDLESKVVNLRIMAFDVGKVEDGKVEKGESGTKRWEGQGGFLRLPGETSNPVFVTAKHNLITKKNDEGIWQICTGHYIVSHKGSDLQINIPGCGWEQEDAKAYFLRDGSYWKTGFDISIGPSIDEAGEGVKWWIERNAATPFDVVEPDFVRKVGMKIGIVVYSVDGAAACDKSELLRDGVPLPVGIDIFDIYGEPNSVVTYTGEITGVGDDYFEHDINTFKGCSGAIVFLLDQRQPATVMSKDYKKAIGVHAGHEEALGVNIAFSLVPEIKKSSSQARYQKSSSQAWLAFAESFLAKSSC